MANFDLDDEWDNFLNENEEEEEENTCYSEEVEKSTTRPEDIPKCGELKISTKTKIVYLNQSFDLKTLFWKIELMDYMELSEGILKKQIKYNFTDKKEVTSIESLVAQESNLVEMKVLTQIDNPNGRVKFKDVRKISIGIDKSNISFKPAKTKSAFYNCFVLIIRIHLNGSFKEVHVKLFNTGKLEIPGIQHDAILTNVLRVLIDNLSPLFDDNLHVVENKEETVLINSNFTCNFYIDREKLFNILKYEYQIKCNYDPCSYPGILCRKYQYKGYSISFMIFRTGSVLIVGKCEMDIIGEIYDFLKTIFKTEFDSIAIPSSEPHTKATNKKSTKKKKKTIYIES